MTSVSDTASAQLPAPGELTLDHVAYFVPHMDAASDALERLGFRLTPFSAQSHRLEAGGPVVPAGTGNRCVMLDRGYLEILAPTGDTGVANQLRAAIKRYVGVHSIVFGTSAPDADYARLEKAGFAPLPPIALQREVATERDTQQVRFTVVRTPPGTMAEGRIQFCRHETPQWVWQDRWVGHPNLATRLAAVLICAPDPAETAQRYARYTGLFAQTHGSAWRMDTARGSLLIVDPATLRRRLELDPPSLPWIAGHVLESGDIGATADYLRSRQASLDVLGRQRLLVRLAAGVGGAIVFQAPGSGHLDFD